MEIEKQSEQASRLRSFLYGMKRRCPKCGEGKLFNGYLAQHNACSHCDEAIGELRADDGPAWLTILIVGHVIAPLLLYLIRHPIMPDIYLLPFLITLTMLLTLITLPIAKGLFIAALWVLYRRK